MVGSCFTIFIAVLTLAYAAANAAVLHSRSSTQFTQTQLQDYHDDSYVFSAEQGLSLAFAFIDQYSSDGSDSYGRNMDDIVEVNANILVIDDHDFFIARLSTHPCSRAELGLVEGEETPFYPVQTQDIRLGMILRMS